MRSRYSPPDTVNFLKRERLFASLDRGGANSAIWIQGPPGAGKTLLAASWVQSRKISCVWNQLDVRDADIGTFITNLSDCLGSEEERQALPSLTPEHLPEYEVFARNYFEQFFSLLPDGAVVVLDNYECLGSDTIIHHLLAIGLEVVPKDIRVLITSRENPPETFARLVANGCLHTVGKTELSLTAEETAGILRCHANSTMPEREELIHRKTEGWVAGVVLLSGCRVQEMNTLHLGNMDTMLQYFAAEVYRPAPEPLRKLLVRTAFLPQMDMAAQTRLCPDIPIDELNILAGKGHFIEQVSGATDTYRYHPLFRDFLQDRARRELTDEELEVLVQDSARLLVEEEEWYEAIGLLRGSNCHEELCRLLQHHGMAMLDAGHHLSLAEIIGSLPASLLQRYPSLLELRGSALLMLFSMDAYQCFEQAWEIRRQGDDVITMLPSLAGAMESISLQRFKLSRLDPWTKHLDQLLDQHPDILSHSQAAPPFIASVLYALSWRQPGHRRLPQLTAMAMEMLHRDLPAALQIKLANAIIINCFWRGDVHVANVVKERLANVASSAQVPPLLQLVHHAVLTTIFFILGDMRKCEEQATHTLELSYEQGFHFFESSLLSYKLIAFLSQGMRDEAFSNLEMLAEIVAADNTTDHSHYYYCRGWFEHGQGNYPQADAHFRMAIDCARTNGLNAAWTISLIGRAESAISAGQYRKANQLLQEAGQDIQPSDNSMLLFMHAMALSRLALVKQDRHLLRQKLTEALQCGARHGFYNWFGIITDHLSALMAEALVLDIKPEYVRELIVRHGLVPPTGCSPGERWPWPVKLYTLGQVRIILNGKELSDKVRQQNRKPLELLLALVAFGGDGVNQKKLADALWPDAEGDKARKTFDTSLYRLRRLLGDDKLLTLKEGVLKLNSKYVWTDLGELARLYKCNMKKTELFSVYNIDIWAEKIALYKGPLLGELYDNNWIWEPRRRAQSWFIELSLSLAGYQRHFGRYNEAILLLNKAIEQDPLQEELYRELMWCYRECRRPGELRDTWERCRQSFLHMLGVEPTEDTRRLLDR